MFVVNKADRDGADRTVRELRQMLELRHAVRGHPGDHDRAHRMLIAASPTKDEPDEWEPPIVKVVAVKDQGVDELVANIARHHAFLTDTGLRRERERTRAEMQFVALLRDRLLRNALDRLAREKGQLTEVSERIADRKADPYALAEELASQFQE